MGQAEKLSPLLTVLSMLNGMIGGVILVLPVLTIESGYVTSGLIIIFTGIFSFYSCYLCVSHLGDQTDLNLAILRHFNGNPFVKILYDLIVWLNLLLINMIYFEQMVQQWQGLIGSKNSSTTIGMINAVILLALVFVLKYTEYGAAIMAYGIVSIIAYIIFLIWTQATTPKPVVSNPFPAFGDNMIGLSASMGQAFSIQAFFIPLMRKSTKTNFMSYTVLTYVIGCILYVYIAYVGAYGILNRPYSGIDQIRGYLDNVVWPIIQVIVLVHLYSVFPELLLIGKRRLFSLFILPQTGKKDMNAPQVLYFILAVGVIIFVGLLGYDLLDLIQINGAVIGLFFIYFLPAVLHIKCLYFSKGKRALKNTQITNQTFLIEIQRQRPSLIQSSLTEQAAPSFQNEESQILPLQQSQLQNSYYYCDCDHLSYPMWRHLLQAMLIIIMLGFGILIMIQGLMEVIDQS